MPLKRNQSPVDAFVASQTVDSAADIGNKLLADILLEY
jgi:hypothetical protein